MTQNVAPPSTTLVAGKYQLLQMIGRGGMGSVWEAQHISLGNKVAIKFIESDYADNEEARKRFDNEARAAATIQSKHAIQIFDHGVTDDGRPFIVMEFSSGEPLDKRIDRMGVMPLQDVARIMNQVCRGLGRAHERGIVHRDLKPENIFIVRDEEDEIAKVLDFGIAKMKKQSHESGLSSSTKTGAVLGTPYYMSPEQARGLRTIDHRTDLWSLGVIAYKCVTGRLPFEGESLGDLLVKICTSPIPVPSHLIPGLPPAFDTWFQRALEREPERRFSTAQELADALAYAAGVSVKHAPMSGGTGLPSGANTRVSSGVPTQGPMTQAPSTTPQQPLEMSAQYAPGNVTSAPFVSSTREPKKSNLGLVVAAAFAVLLGVGLGVFGFIKLTSKPDETKTVAAQPTQTQTPTATQTAPTSTTPVATTTEDIKPLTPTTVGKPVTQTTGTRPVGTGTTKPVTSTVASTTKPLPSTTTTTAPTTTKPGDLPAGF